MLKLYCVVPGHGLEPLYILALGIGDVLQVYHQAITVALVDLHIGFSPGAVHTVKEWPTNEASN